MYSYILLEKEQEDLLCKLVEAVRNVPKNKHEELYIVTNIRPKIIRHSGLIPNGWLEISMGDIDTLSRNGLISTRTEKGNMKTVSIEPEGVKHYEKLKGKETKSIKKVEKEIIGYIYSEQFQKRHPLSYRKWSEAENILWSSETDNQLTTIGHLCREAVQEFADEQIKHFKLSGVDKDKSKTKNRIKQLLELRSEKLGKTEKPFLDAIFNYWLTLIDLIQRQEHGNQKQGKSLVWIDARRVVFHTAIIMYEIDFALGN